MVHTFLQALSVPLLMLNPLTPRAGELTCQCVWEEIGIQISHIELPTPHVGPSPFLIVIIRGTNGKQANKFFLDPFSLFIPLAQEREYVKAREK